jgi:hypothetical protein
MNAQKAHEETYQGRGITVWYEPEAKPYRYWAEVHFDDDYALTPYCVTLRAAINEAQDLIEFYEP